MTLHNRAVWAIARKDIRAITANLQVWLPMVLIPLILGVLMPAGMVLAVRHFGLDSPETQDMVRWLERMPSPTLGQLLDGFTTAEQRVVYFTVNYMLAPFFLLIPLMTSSVISADSFAGEKERGTLESLLFAPVDLLSLFLGKVLAAFLPAMAVSLVTFLLYGTAVNLAGWPLFDRLFFPHANWAPLMLLVIPMISLLAILLNVLISAKVATFQAAYQMGGLIVLPVIALLVGQATGALLLDTAAMLIAGVALAVLNAVLLRLILRGVDRHRLFESQVR